MVTINYQAYGKGFQLRLRLYQGGETRYVSVTRMLKGDLQAKHWNQKKQRLIPSAPYSEENNRVLALFRQKYDEAAAAWTGSLEGLQMAVERGGSEEAPQLLSEFIDGIVEELKGRKHPDGSTKGSWEGYEKLGRRLREYCESRKAKYDRLLVSDVGPSFVNGVMDWIVRERGGKGHVYISAMLHAAIARADKAGLLKMSDFSRCKWRGKDPESSHKYRTLTRKQCARLASMPASELPGSPRAELFRDFCLFLLYTGQSPCDAIALRWSDIRPIGGVDHFVFRRRKIAEKQAVPCAVPINPVMRAIMDRWAPEARDGYVFPVRDAEKLRERGADNSDIKRFVAKLNIWLKKLGAALGCKFPLHTYVFRHTAITLYLSRNVPVVYVANLMGTSVKNCERVYYNNRGDRDSRDMVLGAVEFE